MAPPHTSGEKSDIVGPRFTMNYTEMSRLRVAGYDAVDSRHVAWTLLLRRLDGFS